jgi:4-hydroxybenzoate polyprenyltransferase
MILSEKIRDVQAPAHGAAALPLCVELDGSLIKTSVLGDGILLLVRTTPLLALKLPLWAARGRSYLESMVSSNAPIDITHLPFNRPLLAYLHAQQSEGREIFLVSDAPSQLTDRIEDYLGIFAGVVRTEKPQGEHGRGASSLLKRRFEDGFDYIGGNGADTVALASARHAMLANPGPSLTSVIRGRRIIPSQVFEDRKPLRRSIPRAMRVHQWLKNVLILIPLFLAHAFTMNSLLKVSIAFFSFCLCASATYVVNDLLDVHVDRRHPEKRFRPFAAGDLSTGFGVGMAALLFSASIAGATQLPLSFLRWLSFYAIATLAYSLWLKKLVLVDVILLSTLYTLRLLAGAAAAQVKISGWLGGFAAFLFLSLAMVKRFSELQNSRAQGNQIANGRGYLLVDLEQIRCFGTASAYASIVVFSLYINNRDVIALYGHAPHLWLIVPFMILWISRVWLLAGRGELNEDPVVFAITDRISLLIGLCVGCIVLWSM